MFPDSSPAAEIHAKILDTLPTLGLTHEPASAVTAVRSQLLDLSAEDLIGHEVVDRNLAESVRAGLLLRAGLDDDSHVVSQSIETSDGCFWHGIMHRREPDYPNSKYWFRRVGDHPLFAQLAHTVKAEVAGSPLAEIVSSSNWNPMKLIDLCETCEHGPKKELRRSLESLQDREVTSLLDYCTRGALGAR